MSAAAPNPGPVPELAWLPVAKITVDHSYQRTLESRRSQQLIERIAADFQWSAFQAVLACPAEGGGWLVLDGQHRVEAARRSGIAHVPAVVVAGGSVADQARAFVRANLDRVGLTRFSLFHARVRAEDEAALALKRVCDRAGIDIPRYPIPANKLKPGQTLTIGIIAQMIARQGEDYAATLLTMIAKACSQGHGLIKASLVRACWRIAGDDEVAIAGLGRVLGATNVEKFFAFAAARRARLSESENDSVEAELRGRLQALTRHIHTPAESTGHTAQAGLATMAKPAPSNRAEAGRGERAPISAPRPAAIPIPGSSAASRADELAEQAAFIRANGVAVIEGAVKTVATNEQAVEALTQIGVRVQVGSLYTMLHGRKIYTSKLIDATNALLAQRQLVRVKPAEARV